MAIGTAKAATSFAFIVALLFGALFVLADTAYASDDDSSFIVRPGFDDRFIVRRPFINPFLFNLRRPFINPFIFDDELFFDDDVIILDDDRRFFGEDERDD